MSGAPSPLAAQPHDAFFKAQFSKLDVARALFQSKLPANLVPAIDWSQLTLEPVSFVKNALKQLHSDLIYSLHIDQTIDFNAICDTIRQNQELSEKAMTIAQQLHNEGLEKGLQKGCQEGEFAVCHRLLERKFPGLAERIKPQLMVMDEERLLAFSEALLFFQAEQDCRDWFKA